MAPGPNLTRTRHRGTEIPQGSGLVVRVLSSEWQHRRRSARSRVQSALSSSHILTHKESVTNEAYTLRLRPCGGGFPVGLTVALSCLWQDCNREGLDPRCCLRRWQIRRV